MRTVVVGGSSGLGLEIARNRAKLGDDVVVTSRDASRAAEVAASLGEGAHGVVLDLAEPTSIAAAFEGVDRVDNLVLTAIDRDQNTLETYDVAAAIRLATLKLIGYTEVVHALLGALHDDSAIVIFGGRAKDRPYPGSTTVSTVNGGVVGMVNSMVTELKPIRVNALHPGIIGNSPFWAAKPPEVLEGYRSRTPTGRLASMADVVGAVDFLLTNQAINGLQLDVDGGWLLM
jgi:NAD(P)-dependent dehydrogenase (short-subunit alcohol dehydrogenase family)